MSGGVAAKQKLGKGGGRSFPRALQDRSQLRQDARALVTAGAARLPLRRLVEDREKLAVVEYIAGLPRSTKPSVTSRPPSSRLTTPGS